MPWVKFSPFYAHPAIPVAGMPNQTAISVEGIWQGLKVFINYDYDVAYFKKAFKGIKRTVKTFGTVKGHWYNGELLDYEKARNLIFIPTYHYILDHYLQDEIEQLHLKLKTKDLVLLDFTTNEDVSNPKTPLSHAGVLKKYIYKKYSDESDTSIQLSIF
jgi:hypothetical protein